ncbi:MAG: helix-turn-helix domain-containing protein [Planctomycetota bacterium]|nr:helix-turn-helix domain-containing protein [Planctomycetota bacterium]
MRQSELAALTGLKQPNLSRIENGLVVPRPSTLQKVAMALDVQVRDLLSEDKAREVEAKWGAMLSPKNAGQLFAGKLTPVPLFSSNNGYNAALDGSHQPAGKMELTLQLLPVAGRTFALRVADDSMQAANSGTISFKHNEVVIFADRPPVQNGDLALVHTLNVTVFRKVTIEENGERLRLSALNVRYPDQVVPKNEVLRAWKLVRHIQEF